MSNSKNTKEPIVQKIYTKTDESGYTVSRDRAQKISFAKFQELLQRNVGKTFTKTFTTYTKELLRNYISSPNNSQDNIREISRFLCRYSMLYKKLLMYYPSMPLFYYNITQLNDFTKEINSSKSIKNYQNLLKNFSKFELTKDSYSQMYMSLRDGFAVWELYDSGEDGKVWMPLDVQYCRIYGKTQDNQWIVYYDAAYFDKNDNKNYIYGANNDGIGAWSEQHIKGYEDYKNNGRDYEWYRLDPNTTFCLTACPDDEFYAPLPFFLPLFELILDDIDLQELINNRKVINDDNTFGKTYEVSAVAGEGKFTLDAATKKITLPDDVTGRVFVNYEREAENAVKVTKTTDSVPAVKSLLIHAIFHNPCNKNIVYAGYISCPRAQIDPSSVELNLTAEGKHAASYILQKPYCDTEAKLFDIIVTQD